MAKLDRTRCFETQRYLLRALIVLPVLLWMLAPGITNGQQRPAFLADDVTYLWPTNASRYMSSTFAETRAAHFHAAIDIGTWGREGYPVYAARDGVVHRIGVSPTGYGNVIYLRHNDDSISLYAHLLDFHPSIRQVVDSLRMQDYTFDFDQVLESYELEFARGQVIGWTGSTGVGPPHLHFELRSPQGRPFNPLLAGIKVEDTIAPRFSGLAIEPLSADASINMGTGIYRARAAQRSGVFDFGSVHTTGEIGLAVNVSDRADGSGNVHAVYELEMLVNGERYFHSRVDSFSFDQSRQMFIDRVFPILSRERRGYQRLYVRNANTLPFYFDTGHTGRLNLPEGRHDIRIIASDFFGNRSEARLRLIVPETTLPVADMAVDYPVQGGEQTNDHADALIGERINSESVAALLINPVPLPDYQTASSASRLHPPETYWHKNWIRSTRETDSLALQLQYRGTFLQESVVYSSLTQGLPLDLGERKILRYGTEYWNLRRITPEHAVTLYHDAMKLSVHFPGDTFFEPVSVGLSGTFNNFTFHAPAEPFRRAAQVRIVLPDSLLQTEGLGLYRQNASNQRLIHVSSNIDHQQRVLHAGLSATGTYVLHADTLAPEIDRPRTGRWAHNGQHFVTVRVRDNLSGLAYRTAEFYVNGIRGIAEYDPEKQLLRYHHPDFRPAARNELEVRIRDHAGNWAEAVFTDVPGN